MHYTVYKIINNINGKIYIGQHRTNNLDDGYMGSGTLISKDIKEFGKENFSKEYLHIFDNPNDMYDAEAKLVNPDFVLLENTYNMTSGGNKYPGDSQKGKKNSQFGKKWISNIDLESSKRINITEIDDYLNNGWRLGRVIDWNNIKCPGCGNKFIKVGQEKYCSLECKKVNVKKLFFKKGKFYGREEEFYKLYVKHGTINKALSEFLGYDNGCYYYDIAREIIEAYG